MNMSAIINQMSVLFLVIAIGYTANKLKILTLDSNKLLTKLVLNIGMPCLILNSVMSGTVTASGSEAVLFMLMVLVMYALMFILIIPVPWLNRSLREDKGLSRFMIVFGNVGFMGFPVIQSIFGTGAVFYVALFNMVFTVLSFSIGIIMISGNGKNINPKLFLNPSLFSAIIAVLLFAFNARTPIIIANTANVVGQLTTPCAMLIIGSSLAAIPFREVFREIRIYPITVMRLIIVPILTWLVLRMFITNQLMLGVLVVLSGMPTATNATMLSLEYGANEKYASTTVFVTTLLSVATIPLLVFMFFSNF